MWAWLCTTPAVVLIGSSVCRSALGTTRRMRVSGGVCATAPATVASASAPASAANLMLFSGSLQPGARRHLHAALHGRTRGHLHEPSREMRPVLKPHLRPAVLRD